MKKPAFGILMVVCAVSVAACSQSNNAGDNSLAGAGQGGSSSNHAGNAGSTSGGAGGSSSSGGNGNGGNSPGNGGNGAGVAGESNGGSSLGGSAGASSGGAAGGGAANGGAAGGGDGGSAGQGGAPPDGGNTPGPSLDECFEGLRDGTGTYQDATKASADGLYSFRLALETADRFGTSGTRPWGVYRFALETPDASVCVTDEAPLVDAYQVTHHNCEDVFSWTQGDLRYEIEHPDTAVDRPSALTIYQGQTVVAGPIRLDLADCHFSSFGECSSGGPCGAVLD